MDKPLQLLKITNTKFIPANWNLKQSTIDKAQSTMNVNLPFATLR